TWCRPSPRTTGPAYESQAPVPIRYEMPATPLVASVALRTTVTLEMNQPLAPDCPERSATEAGATVSTETAMERTVSESPARSDPRYSTRCWPSARRNGPL